MRRRTCASSPGASLQPQPAPWLNCVSRVGRSSLTGELAQVLRRIETPTPPAQLLVGTATGDDAAVWRLDDGQALVSTADFITPVVDDARAWGRVAAANSVSDVYAMGGRPLFALNLVGWNNDALPLELLAEVLAGGQDVATEAGFVVAGGHTIDDPEPKYGMAVTGLVDPDRMLTNAGLRPGQDLILSKPLGVGVITTAIKADVADEATATAAVDSMTRLNAEACQAALDAGATGCTDVTGFGLLGHLGRMAVESEVLATVEVDRVPLLPGARQLADQGIMAGGSRRNLAAAADLCDPGAHDELTQLLMADAQTSGGLVFGVDPSATDDVLARLAGTGHRAAHIGSTAPGRGIALR
ncbi:MAG: selenide, water dikinase SelD [Actinomycetota bacterium]